MEISSLAESHVLYDNFLHAALLKLFPSIQVDLLNEIASKMEWFNLHAGEILFDQGDEGNSMYILLSGRLQAIVNEATPAEKVVGEIIKGESAGEMSLITGEKRTATVKAVRDSILAKLSKEDFEKIITEHPQLVMGISRQIIQRLTTTIHQITKEKKFTSIAVVPVNENVDIKAFTRSLSNALEKHSSTLMLTENSIEKLTKDNAAADVGYINWLAEQELKHDVILYETGSKHNDWTFRCVRQSDKVLVVINAGDNVASLNEKIEWLKRDYRLSAIEVVIAHPADTLYPVDTYKLLEHPAIRQHYHIRKGNQKDVQRLGRILTGKANALVLSGGGARGLAHIGVFKALHEAGIPIDLVAGTSIGSIVAAGIAMDWTPEKVQSEARTAFLVDKPLKDYTLPLISLIKGKQLQNVNHKYFQKINIEDLWINYFCVSSNFSTSELKIHQRGLLFKAITASASIPGVLPPVVDNNQLLIDGGVMNNFPVDIMRKLYNCNIIGVDLSAEKEYSLNYERIPGGWYYLWNKFLPFGKKYRVPGIATIMMKSTLLGSFQKQIKLREEVDLYFNPPVGKYKLLDMKAFDKLVEVGYKYAVDVLQNEEIKKKVWQE